MSVQMIELEEVSMIDVSDEALEGSAISATTTYTGVYYCVPC